MTDKTNLSPDMNFTPATVFAFEGNERAKQIDHRMLEHTREITDSNGRPEKNRPIQAYKFLCLIEAMIKDQNLDYIIEPVWIQNKAARRIIKPAEKELYTPKNTRIEDWLFNNMITRIHLPHVEDLDKKDQGVNVAIAIAYKDKGIEVAFGLNEKICENMQIMGQSEVLRTYGSEGLNFENMLSEINGWLCDFDDMRHVQVEKMNEMKNLRINNPNAINIILGKLYRAAINQTYGDKTPAPFDTYGISNFTQQVIKLSPELKSEHTVWDVYNCGTRTIKPEFMDLCKVIETSAKFADFLIDEFQLNSKAKIIDNPTDEETKAEVVESSTKATATNKGNNKNKKRGSREWRKESIAKVIDERNESADKDTLQTEKDRFNNEKSDSQTLGEHGPEGNDKPDYKESW